MKAWILTLRKLRISPNERPRFFLQMTTHLVLLGSVQICCGQFPNHLTHVHRCCQFVSDRASMRSVTYVGKVHHFAATAPLF